MYKIQVTIVAAVERAFCCLSYSPLVGTHYTEPLRASLLEVRRWWPSHREFFLRKTLDIIEERVVVYLHRRKAASTYHNPAAITARASDGTWTDGDARAQTRLGRHTTSRCLHHVASTHNSDSTRVMLARCKSRPKTTATTATNPAARPAMTTSDKENPPPPPPPSMPAPASAKRKPRTKLMSAVTPARDGTAALPLPLPTPASASSTSSGTRKRKRDRDGTTCSCWRGRCRGRGRMGRRGRKRDKG